MMDLLSKFDGGELIGLVSVVGCLVCGTVAIVMGVGLAHRKVELKKSMVERGMSAEEIRIVMDAGTDRSVKRENRKQTFAEV